MKLNKKTSTSFAVTIDGRVIHRGYDSFNSLADLRANIWSYFNSIWYGDGKSQMIVRVSVSQEGGYQKSFNMKVRAL